MQNKPKILLMDANVLIDYQKSDFSILGQANKYVGEVHILTTILKEVKGLDASECERFGLKVIEPELPQVVRASINKGALSFYDHLCLIVASDEGFVCVTNDKALRRACNDVGVKTLWGLEIITELVRTQLMQASDAIRVAKEIHLKNKVHIPKTLLKRFSQIVTDIENQ